MSSAYDDIFNDSEMLERTLMFSKIAGITFENRQLAARNCYKGMRLYLRREPHNRYDANAIAVCADCGLTQCYKYQKTSAGGIWLVTKLKKIFGWICTLLNLGKA